MTRHDDVKAVQVWLNVPFDEKDQVKALGAHWDPVRRLWWVEDQADLSAFERWLQWPTRAQR